LLAGRQAGALRGPSGYGGPAERGVALACGVVAVGQGKYPLLSFAVVGVVADGVAAGVPEDSLVVFRDGQVHVA
jgi:hypothetical protein